TFPDGPRLCRVPVREIGLEPGRRWVPRVSGALFDLEAAVSLTRMTEEVGVFVQGTHLRYLVGEGCFLCLGRRFAVPATGGRLVLRLLVDRTSLELFVTPGRVPAGFCRPPGARDAPLELYALGGGAEVSSLTVRELASAWPQADCHDGVRGATLSP
ncbi:MAG TPA: hypothetical protein VLH81_12585, partial [Desulfobacterales bacterium]|nr:hypothetical protein [Desulfobacterales bacterium]